MESQITEQHIKAVILKHNLIIHFFKDINKVKEFVLNVIDETEVKEVVDINEFINKYKGDYLFRFNY